MANKKSRLEEAEERTQAALNKTNAKIDELGKVNSILYAELCNIQNVIDAIRNMPDEEKLRYNEQKKICREWRQQVEKIEKDYKNAMNKNAGMGAVGASVGVATVAFGPTAAMGVATTFGVASTGTAISTLSGAAATNAALAWLGGGALAAGGGGMAAGNFLLWLAGPVGWTIAGVSLLTGGILFWRNQGEKKRLEDIFTLISERDTKNYVLAIVELNERNARIKDESGKLREANKDILSFGLDYDAMSEAQQYALGSYVNLMKSATQLLVNPIQGLLPKYTEADLKEFAKRKFTGYVVEWCDDNESMITYLANLLYKIELDRKDQILLWKFFRKNKELLRSYGISEKDFIEYFVNITVWALEYKYSAYVA